MHDGLRVSRYAVGCVVAVAMAVLLLVAGCSGGDRQSPKQSGDASAVVADTTANGMAEEQRIDGWWQTLGQSGSVYHHFANGADYMYMQSLDDLDSFSFDVKMGVKSIDPFSSGEYAGINESGVVVSLSNGSVYFQMDSDTGTLQSRKADGSGYSGSSSLVRAGSIPAPLESLAEETERSL